MYVNALDPGPNTDYIGYAYVSAASMCSATQQFWAHAFIYIYIYNSYGFTSPVFPSLVAFMFVSSKPTHPRHCNSLSIGLKQSFGFG